ncbi:MAG: formylmethanofuran dehydrogenase subunit E family protein [Deltaproteobacteria bacterium]|nr:formylmethanofuran dehydrogenase subunit E family protein [Deltaproteobacteria bacterium]
MRLTYLHDFEETVLSGLTLSEALDKIEGFHGSVAPGILIGGLMIDLAQELVGDSILYNAVVETPYCLPDAVQIFTPCTMGNNWLKVVDYGRFAVTLYNKDSGKGIRVWVDLNKLEGFRDVFNWFLKRAPKKELPLDVLLPAILHAGREMLSYRNVRVFDQAWGVKKGAVGVCPACGESYPVNHGTVCRACAEGPYYCASEEQEPLQ